MSGKGLIHCAHPPKGLNAGPVVEQHHFWPQVVDPSGEPGEHEGWRHVCRESANLRPWDEARLADAKDLEAIPGQRKVGPLCQQLEEGHENRKAKEDQREPSNDPRRHGNPPRKSHSTGTQKEAESDKYQASEEEEYGPTRA